MFDAVHMQRSAGVAFVAMDRGRLTGLSQSGSAKVMLPRSHGPAPEIVFLNTSGGLTSGDRLEYGLSLAPGSRATATTQTAERAYRADTGPARARVALSVGAGAALDWLPQETILFDGARLGRETVVDLAGNAEFLGLETVVLGRAAMGEVLTRIWLEDRRTIRRDGRLELLDPLRLDDATLARSDGPALLMGARAFAVLILSAHGAEDRLPAIRAALDEPGVMAAASALPGRVVLRATAADAWPLRRQMARLIETLRPGGLPRVWQS
ncbi:urease accessory protein UreD [Paracoccus marinaquae]|uniref:Urease accessory protein UreD n=1 Tax=Paracoccus marinaquae TaxID=2841926 RepID=A0ABS6ALK3_9RHOB|nr:urease accessory protein UreD [Paracoccus marinaquae]MBU3030772.1 urease accessory protein UreD [Paracoccus marinaquae]